MANSSAQEGAPATRWFEVDALNTGLGPAPDSVNRETPQSALESFIAAARAENFKAAAHILDLRAIPAERQSMAGEEFARRLADVIDRKIWIDWASLRDRPDGLSATGSDTDARAGEPRRDIAVGRLHLDGVPVSLRLRRLKPTTDEPAWVFSRQTVENIDGLYKVYGPSAFERRLPSRLKNDAIGGLAWWELVALPLAVLAMLALGVVLYRSLGRIAGRGEDDEVVARVFDAARLPVTLMVTGLAGWVLTRWLFVFSAPVDTFMAPLWTLLIIVAILAALVRVADEALDFALGDRVDDIDDPANNDQREIQTNLSIARRVVILIAFLIGAAAVISQTNLFNGTAVALLGSAGVLTLVLGFAARSALSNIMSSLQIALSKSAKIGDSVLFEGHWCNVEKINFTYIQLKSWDSRRIIVPVNYFVSNPFENWTKRDPTMTKTVELRLNHFADIDALRKRFDAFVENDKAVLTKNEAKVQVIDHDASGMLVRFYADARDPSAAWDMQCRLREAMLKAVQELEPLGGDQPIFVPAERETKIADFTA